MPSLDGFPAQELDEFDIVIVGGRTAGCVLTNRLSQSELSVLLIEARQNRNDDPRVSTPRLFPQLLRNPDFD